MLIPAKTLRVSPSILRAHVPEIAPAQPAENSDLRCARCVAGSSPTPLRNPVRNIHSGKRAAAHRPAREHQSTQIDRAAEPNPPPKTAATPLASSVNVAPETLAQSAYEMLKLFCCRCTFRHGCKLLFSRIGIVWSLTQLTPSFFLHTDFYINLLFAVLTFNSM